MDEREKQTGFVDFMLKKAAKKDKPKAYKSTDVKIEEVEEAAKKIQEKIQQE